jgi:Flp pilus assembly protein TadG
MAIIAPVFMLVLVAIIEMSMMFFATLTMQYAVREGANDGGTSTQQRYATVIAKIRDNSLGMYERMNCVVSVNGKSYASTNYSNAMFGGAGDMVVLQLNCAWPVTTPLLSAFFTGGQNSFAVGATMRNEYF